MDDLDPMRGTFRWALAKTRAHLAGVSVGIAFVGVLGALLSPLIPALPTDPSLVQRLVNALANGVGVAFAAGAGVYAVALLAAPYQQRNLLRRRATPSAAAQLRQLLARGRSILALSPMAQTESETTTSVTAELNEASLEWYEDTCRSLAPWPEHLQTFRIVTDRSFPGQSSTSGWHHGILRRVQQLEAIVDAVGEART